MPKDNTGKTNELSETLTLETGEVLEEEDDDENIVPPLEEEVTSKSVEELKSSSKEEPDDEEYTEDTEETETVLKQPKPVEGETTKETALRIQIVKLRQAIRDKDELIKITPPPMDNEEYEELRQDYTDEELQKVEKLFDVIGKKKGYVKSADIYTQSGNEVLENFLIKHPEYKPENDPEDVRWNTFKDILTNDYNRTGKKPKELEKLFEKVNRDVLEEFGDSPKRVIETSRLNAAKQKIRSVSHTGGTKTEVNRKSNAPTDPKVRAMFKDFDDEDF